MLSQRLTAHSAGLPPAAVQLNASDMTQPNLFRLFVGLSIVFGVAGAAVDYCFTELLSQDLANALENEPSIGIAQEYPFVSLAILIPWLIAAVVGVVGFFLFKPWGRTL